MINPSVGSAGSRSRRLRGRGRRILVVSVALPVIALVAGLTAFAYWTTSGTGNGNASVGTLTAPGQPSRTGSGSTVDLDWTASTVSGGGTIGYHVERSTDPVTTWSDACGTTVGSPTTLLTCIDSPGAGTYRYRVTAIYNSWTAEGLTSNAFVAAPSDVTAPTVTDVTITNDVTGAEGVLKQGSGYYVYANASDDVGGSGVASVTADVSTLTTSGTAVPLPTCSSGCTVGSTTYGFKSALQTANGSLSEGSKAYTVTATDNASLTGNKIGSATVDNTAPVSSAPLSPVANGAGWNSSQPVLVTLSATDTNGIDSITFSKSGAETAAPATYSAPFNVTAEGTTTVSFHARDTAGNVESPDQTADVRIDLTNPAGGSITANGSGSDSYNTTGTVALSKTDFTDTPSGILSNAITRATATLSGNVCTGGFSGATPVTISGGNDPASLPTGCYQYTLTGTDNAGRTSTALSAIVKVDTSAPVGGSITANGSGSPSFNTTGTLALSKTDFTDAQSGIASNVITRASGTLTNNVCGALSGATVVTISGGNDPASLPTGCYQYTLTGTNNAGAQATATSAIVKVDTSAPVFGSPALTLSATGSFAFYNGSPNSTTAYYNGTTGTGSSIIVNAPNVADPETGIQNVIFPNIASFTGGVTDISSPFTTTYTWSSSSANGSQTVTATNGINNTATNTFALVRDITAPTGGTLTPSGTVNPSGSTSYSKTGTFIITRADYAETQSGTASGLASSTLVRTQATYANSTGACGSFGTPTTVPGAVSETTLVEGCYRYTLTGTDNVLNTVSTSVTVIVDTTVPTLTSVVAVDGKTAGKIDHAGSNQDTLTFTYSENINPASITTGNNSVIFTNNDATCSSSADSIAVPGVGKVCLGSQAWLTATSTKTESLSVSGNAVTMNITNDPTGNASGVAASNFTWSASGGTAADFAGNAATGSVTTNTQRF